MDSGGVSATLCVSDAGTFDFANIMSISLSLVTHIVLRPISRPCFCSSVLVKLSLRNSRVGLLSDGDVSLVEASRVSVLSLISELIDGSSRIVETVVDP